MLADAQGCGDGAKGGAGFSDLRNALAIVKVFLETPTEFHFMDIVRVEGFGESLGEAASVFVKEGHVTEDECQGGVINSAEG